MSTIEHFSHIPTKMLWREAALEQLRQFALFCTEMAFPWVTVGEHTSKSIPLPVIRMDCPGMEVYLRDNFHDINICVVANQPFRIPLSVLFEDVLEPHSWDWYLEQVARAREYSWQGWTNEQMDMPGILTLFGDCKVKSLAEKARWVKRLTDPEWYDLDWSRGKIIWEGDFGPGVTMWVQVHPFMEGIRRFVPSKAAKPYEVGCSSFALALHDLDQARMLIKRLLGAK